MDMTLQVTSAARNGKGQQLMDMTGERRIPAPRQKVWEALNDTAMLKACIPGCDSLEKIGESDLKATAALKIGPISAKFAGKVTLSDIDPPNGYTITGEGQGGVAGFAKGGASVRLVDDGDGTLLTYDVKAQVGGKIAQLGARLIDATAKQMSDQFFDRFTAALTPTPQAAPPVSPVPREMLGIPMVGWIGIVIFLFILALLVRGFFL
jgi:carbon monoxide dehydrogenase subunit G